MLMSRFPIYQFVIYFLYVGKLKSVGMSVCVTAGLMFAAHTGVAHAETGTVVSFGASYFADPEPLNHVVNKINGSRPCTQGDNNIPQQVAAKTGLELRDYSCSGATGYRYFDGPNATFRIQVENAIHNGDLNANTRLVMVEIGGNDAYVFDVLTLPPQEREGRYAEMMDGLLPLIRQHAPNAQIELADYPPVSDPNTGHLCAIHVNTGSSTVDPPIGIPLDLLRSNEIEISNYVRDAAARHNATFINLRSELADCSTCSAPGQRAVAGLIDNTSTPYRLVLHTTAVGADAISQVFANNYKRG